MQFGGGARFCGRAKPPLCKGRWMREAQTEGLWPCEGRSMYGQGHNPPPASREPPLHKGALNSPPIEFIWPRRGQSERGAPYAPSNARALRADMESAPTVRTKGCDNRKVVRGVEDAAPYIHPRGDRRGAQCAPVQFGNNASPGGRAMLAPTATARLRVGGDACIAP